MYLQYIITLHVLWNLYHSTLQLLQYKAHTYRAQNVFVLGQSTWQTGDSILQKITPYLLFKYEGRNVNLIFGVLQCSNALNLHNSYTCVFFVVWDLYVGLGEFVQGLNWLYCSISWSSSKLYSFWLLKYSQITTAVCV